MFENMVDQARPLGQTPLSWQCCSRNFAEPRLKHYLSECGENQGRAMELYEWNAELSAAFWHSLSYFEVSFRNAIDRRMSELQSAKGRASHWIFDDYRELGRDAHGRNKHAQPYQEVHEAKGRVRQNKKQAIPSQVISEMSFGFWHQMVSKKQVGLWPDLAAAFPHSPDRAQSTIHDPISRLRSIRNRIGHHHRIWAVDVPGRYADLLAITSYIDPELEAWIDDRSAVLQVWARRPADTQQL